MDSYGKVNPPRNSTLRGWLVFTACLLLLSLGATSYHKIADVALISVRLSLLVVLSILVVRERWTHDRDPQLGKGEPRDAGESILQRFRRWYYDEER